MKYNFFSHVVMLVCLTSLLHGVNNVIFELDDLLFTPNQDTSALKGLVTEKTIDHYRSRLFEIVAKIPVQQRGLLPKVFFKDLIFPSAWCWYFINKFSSKEMHDKVSDIIKKEIAWFWPERSILLHAASLAFNPEAEASIMLPVTKGHELVRACAQNPHNRLFLFSNKNTETITALQKKYPDFFKLFYKIAVSGTLKQLKPSKAAYKSLLATYKLNPTDCYLIETKPDYLEPAKSLGMQCFLCDTQNIAAVKNDLKKQNVI
ncbi:hypothetical protein H0X48_05550 [Candidatus Dependentiae bacterium]|nr:hypothetical protein [Candidatus Dependentiae bacterium]